MSEALQDLKPGWPVESTPHGSDRGAGDEVEPARLLTTQRLFALIHYDEAAFGEALAGAA
jgi:hypothetical protein